MTACSDEYEKYKTYKKEEIETIINNSLKSNYSMHNYDITFLNKDTLKVCDFWLDGCIYSYVDGAFEYTYMVKNDNREYKVYFKEPYKIKRENKIINYELDIDNLIRGENTYVIKDKINEYKSILYSFDSYEYYDDTQEGVIYGNDMFELKEFLLFLKDNKIILNWNFVITNDKTVYEQLISDKKMYNKYISHYTNYVKIDGLDYSGFENNPFDTHIINYSNDLLECENTCTVIFS